MDFKKLITSKRGLITLLIFFLLTLLIVIYLFFRNTKAEVENKSIKRLTETYTNDLQKKVELPEKEDSMEFLDSETDEIEVVYESPKKTDKVTIPSATDNLDKELKKEFEKKMITVSTLINEKKIDDIKTMFNKQYLKNFKITDVDLEDMFHFINPVKPIVCDIDELSDNRFIVTVRFIDEFGWEKIFDFTIFEDGTIANIPIYSEKELNSVAKKDGVTYTVTKQIETRQGVIFFLNILNTSERVLKVQDMYSHWGNLVYEYENLSYFEDNFEVLPNIDTSLIIKIPNTTTPNDLILVTEYEGNVEEFSIWGNDVVNE